ncbi:MAG: hypothetical protein ACKVQK_31575, partial [Burkholderiales bacterium]
AILYPNSKIVIVASTKEQAGIMIEDKIKSLQSDYPNLAREILNIVTNMNKWAVEFHNGSNIQVVASRDSSRGKRSNYTIYEEFRLIDKEVLDSVIRPFAFIRQVPYLNIPKYSEYVEEPKEVFISSAYHKGLWWWTETKKNIIAMVKGLNAGFIAFDFRIAIEHKIKTLKQIKNEISKMDEVAALEEYFNIAWGENSNSFFRLKHFSKARTVDRAFYPQKDIFVKKNPNSIPRVNDEIRIIACDVAQRGGSKNDLSINICIRLIPTQSKGYIREVSYIESFSGVDSITQSLRIKRLHHEFDADVIVLDVAAGGGGTPIYDNLGQETNDIERGLEYPAFTIMPHFSIDDSVYDEFKNRTLGRNALPIIYPISATAKLNSAMAVEMQDKLKKKLVRFLTDEIRAEDYLIKTKAGDYLNNDDVGVKSFYMQPYVQTSLLINESINLEMVQSAGNLKLIEPSGGRKDRIVTLMMGNYYSTFLDAELLRNNDGVSDLQAILDITMIV